MNALKTLLRLTNVELFKFRSKSAAWLALLLLFITPIGIEVLVMSISRRDSIYPRVADLLFAGEVLLIVAMTNIVVSVVTLSNDYELGTIRGILSRGVDRFQFILSKMIATCAASLANGVAYISGALLASSIVHLRLSDIPFFEAAGSDILWRTLGAIGVVGLIGFVLAGIVMLAMVLGRNSWIGMLAGMGYFAGDFFVGGLGPADILGIRSAYRYAITYHALGILEKLFPSDPALSLPRSWSEEGFADPGRAVAFLLLYGCALTLVSILLFARQDLTAKT
jgi:ABC-type transport system involved in multi-copper enzyme maturation permease subunit